MLRMIVTLVVLLSGLEGAVCQEFKRVSLPNSVRYTYPTETYFLQLKDKHCLQFEESSNERSMCNVTVDVLRNKWDVLYSEVYQIQLNPKAATPERLSLLKTRSAELVMEGLEFPDIRKLLRDYKDFYH